MNWKRPGSRSNTRDKMAVVTLGQVAELEEANSELDSELELAKEV